MSEPKGGLTFASIRHRSELGVRLMRYGIFDHVERRYDVGQAQQYEERLQFAATADTAGFYCYHVAEHHHSPLCLAPNRAVYLAAVGRDPGAFGIEAWIRSSSGGPEQWREAAERWHALGATHVTFYTSGQGVGAVPQQIEAMQRFYDAVR